MGKGLFIKQSLQFTTPLEYLCVATAHVVHTVITQDLLKIRMRLVMKLMQMNWLLLEKDNLGEEHPKVTHQILALSC